MATNANNLRSVTYIMLALSCSVLVQAAQFAGGTGSADDPYRIATAQQLVSLGSGPNQTGTHFLLVNDIDLDPNLPGGRVFDTAVIASGAHPYRDPFAGSFDGGGHTIRNLVIRFKSPRDRMQAWAGLFGGIDRAAVVRNLKLEAADVQTLDRRAGILAGENAGRILNCQVSGRVSSHGSMAMVSLDESGGLVGRNTGSISDCRADTDRVQGDGCAGGLVGYSKGSIQRSYSAGIVAAKDPNAACGGLLGTGATPAVKVMTTACYFLAPTDGGGPDNGFGNPLTDAGMKRQASFLNWDFKNTWMICEGQDYPRLRWEKITCVQP